MYYSIPFVRVALIDWYRDVDGVLLDSADVMWDSLVDCTVSTFSLPVAVEVTCFFVLGLSSALVFVLVLALFQSGAVQVPYND